MGNKESRPSSESSRNIPEEDHETISSPSKSTKSKRSGKSTGIFGWLAKVSSKSSGPQHDRNTDVSGQEDSMGGREELPYIETEASLQASSTTHMNGSTIS